MCHLVHSLQTLISHMLQSVQAKRKGKKDGLASLKRGLKLQHSRLQTVYPWQMTSISGPEKNRRKKGNFLKTLFEGNCRIPHSKLPRASYFSTNTSIALITNKRCFKRAQLHRCIWPLNHSLSSSTATQKGRINDELAVVVGLMLQFGGKLL